MSIVSFTWHFICLKGRQGGSASRRTSNEFPTEEEHDYDYVIVSPSHMARANPPRRVEGSNIPLSVNISYNVII